MFLYLCLVISVYDMITRTETSFHFVPNIYQKDIPIEPGFYEDFLNLGSPIYCKYVDPHGSLPILPLGPYIECSALLSQVHIWDPHEL